MTLKPIGIDDDGQLPARARTALAGNFVDTETPEGAALRDTIADGVAAAFDPTDVGYDVVAILGQSNARGDGEGADLTLLDFPNPRVQQLICDATNPRYRQIVAAIDPLFHHTPATTLANGIGAGVVFGREYAQSMPVNRRLLLVPSARGATGFTSTDYSWDRTATPSIENLYATAVANIHAALNQPGRNRLVAIIWCQGEADVTLSEAQYAVKLDDLIGALRAEFADTALPVLIGSMVPDKVAEGHAGYIAVNRAHQETPRRLSRTWFVRGPFGAYNSVAGGGTIHYNANGQRALGRGYMDALPYARANVAGAAPAQPLSVALTQAGTTVTATWVPAPGRVTDYAVEYRVGSGSWQSLTRAQSLEPSATIMDVPLGSVVTVRVRAVNEQGASTARESSPLTMDALPGQVTGLTASTTTSNRQDLTWTPVTGARSYRVQYKRSSDSAWTDGPLVTGAAASFAGLNVSTSYDYRVLAVNNAGPSSSPSSTLTVSTLSLQALASAVGADMTFGYALRKLRNAYSGAAIRVRRSSDGAEADIGFTAGGVLNEASLLAHVGSGDGFVVTWYDQGTNGANFTQATASAQPQIVAGGVVHKVNGVPSVKFSGAQYLSHSTVALFAAAAATVLTVHTAPASAASAAVYGEDNNGTAGYYFPQYYNGAGQPTFYDGTTARVGSGLVLNGALQQTVSLDTGSALSIDVNGANRLSYAPYTPPAATMQRARIGAYMPGAVTAYYNGFVSEIAAWTSNIGSTPISDGRSNQKTFYGTP